MVRCATVPFLAVLVACEGPPLAELRSVPPMAADTATPDADAEADDVGSTAAGLDPVRTLHAGGSNAHHVVRRSAGHLVGVVQRNDAGRFRAFLHRLPDSGEVPAPEDPTSGIGDHVNVESVVLAPGGRRPPRGLRSQRCNCGASRMTSSSSS